MNIYEVRTIKKDIEGQPVIRKAHAPGSKSITNRALLLAALSDKSCVLEGALFSDDSRYFAKALIELGFEVELDEENKRARIKGCGGAIPKNNAEIYVGSAGTAARFLTAMLGFSGGHYIINASEQMKKRPMKPLFDALEELGVRIKCLEQEGCLPIEIDGIKKPAVSKVDLDISKSTQFLSALLMTMNMLEETFEIRITSEKKTGSYIDITSKIMNDFSLTTDFNGVSYKVSHFSGQKKGLDDSESESDSSEFRYFIEPDVSAACYFYAAAMICGLSVQVLGVHRDVMQGDIRFLEVLENMGGVVTEHADGLIFTGPKAGSFSGIDVNMNNFSDQALTLSVVAAFAKTPTRIRGIEHIRGQECDRIAAIVNELTKIGIKCEEIDDGIRITPGEMHGADIETYDDHRVAMSFTLVGLKVDGIRILNPECTRKTFENYFDEIEGCFEL